MIKYIGYFDFQDSNIPRNYVVAATNKMEYIAEAFNKTGYDIEMISVSASTESRFRFHRAETKRCNPRFSVKFFATFGGSGRLLRIVRTIWHMAALFFYLLVHTRKSDSIVVYHSLGYYNIILWAKRIRRFRLILEVEEIYQDVRPIPGIIRKWEYRMFEAADAYIFSTELLNEKLNGQNKPYLVIYGTYRVEPPVAEAADDGKIHVVYAGTFDIKKGGAAAAAAAAEFLPGNYHLHIIGFGTQEDIDRIERTVADTASKSEATVTLDGLFKGRNYTEFLQRCHIGLSTQDPSAAFNATSFPSKILSYMANGLQVVSIRIDAVTRSAVGDRLTYYNCQTPREIADAIRSTDTTATGDNRRTIAELDRRFTARLPELLG